MTPSEGLVLRAGQSTRLRCEAVSGSPRPRLSWQREAKQGLTDLAPQVSLEEDGAVAVLQLSQVTRHEAGQYVCSADNGHQSQPVTERVRLHVEFPPELSVENHVVTTSLGAEVELTCIVHAYPHAQLSWKKVNRRPRDDTFNNL